MISLLFTLIVWFGQTAVRPVFEVASIKEALPPSSIENILAEQFHIGMNIDGFRADYGFMSLADLIPYAYGVKRYQLSGPSWMNETRWDIVARIPEGQPADRCPEMMQDLLAARFKLSIHRESREQSVYALVLGKGGRKIKEAATEEATPLVPQPTGGLSVRINDGKDMVLSGGATGTMLVTAGSNGGFQLQMAKITMAALADRLTQFMDRPVVDATELKGNYQVTLELPSEAMMGMAFAQKLAVLGGLGYARGVGVPEASGPDALDSAIIQAVKNLGLELQPRKSTVKTIMVDRVEKTPTAN